jgi:hypothetical protein
MELDGAGIINYQIKKKKKKYLRGRAPPGK